MGSSTMENGASDEKYCDEVSKRPAFYPCQICGEFFTSRAMQVHKNTCLENENCQCSVCKSKSKKTDWENLKKKGKTSLKHSSEHVYKKKKKSKMNGQLQDLLLEKMGDEKHTTVNEYESELSTLKLVEKDSYLINKAVSDNQTLKNLDPSVIDECAENNEHECVSPPSETSESSQAEASDVSENSYYRPYEVVMLKDKLDHDCDRKLFCCFCNEHLYWESFGLHVIKHCQSVAAPNGGKRHLKCPDSKCDRQFSQPALFLTHYLSHNLEHPVVCSDCLCSNLKCSAVSRVANEHGYAELEPFHCYICLTRFSHTQTVINHMRLHSKEMPYKCAVCDRTFRQIGNLQRHMTTHRGERPYKCSKCPSSFADPATLRNHERIHTGETPYVCNVCSRGFTQIGNLKRHMALHLQKDPASTTLHSTVEVSSDENTIAIINPPEGLKINLNTEPQRGNTVKNPSEGTVTNISALCRKVPGRRTRRKSGKMKVFTCTICNKVYAWQHDLTVHFRTHTGEKPYGCELCGKHFAQSGAVRIHKDRHHSGVNIK